MEIFKCSFLALVLVASGVVAKETKSPGCKKTYQQLQKIESRLSAGYGEPQGNKLRAKRHELEDIFFSKHCKKYRKKIKK